jgi:hypothetical protein
VRYDKNLPDKAKLLYGEITALCNKEGYCWASNAYFAELYGVTTVSISRLISKLKQAGYISVTLIYKEKSKEVDKRIVRIVQTDPINKNVNTPIQKCVEGTLKIVKDNTTLNNTNNIISEYVCKVQSSTLHGTPNTYNDDFPLQLEAPVKYENIFAKATQLYGERICREALRIVDEFIDIDYPKFRNKPHPPMNRGQRMAFAVKLMECYEETSIDLGEIEQTMYLALQDANCDPTILYTTTPQVLGYWLIKRGEIGYESIHHTAYEPVEAYY